MAEEPLNVAAAGRTKAGKLYRLVGSVRRNRLMMPPSLPPARLHIPMRMKRQWCAQAWRAPLSDQCPAELLARGVTAEEWGRRVEALEASLTGCCLGGNKCFDMLALSFSILIAPAVAAFRCRSNVHGAVEAWLEGLNSDSKREGDSESDLKSLWSL